MEKETNLRAVDLSACEKQVLSCVYEYQRKAGEAPELVVIMELIRKKYGKEWKMQTVCTFLTRMEKKGLLTIRKEKRHSHYYPVMPYEVYLEHELGEICNMYFENDMKQMKRYMRGLH